MNPSRTSGTTLPSTGRIPAHGLASRLALASVVLLLAPALGCSRGKEVTDVALEGSGRADARPPPSGWACLRPIPHDIVYIGMAHMLRACDAGAESVLMEPATTTLMARVAGHDRFSEPLPEQPEILLLLSDTFGGDAAAARRVVGLTRDCRHWIGATHSSRVTCDDLQALAMLRAWSQKVVPPGTCVCSGP